jgi:NAD(P)H dehydrogenase (quinone)
MAKVLIIYHTRSGNTEKLAKIIEEGIKSEGVETVLKKVQEVEPKEMIEYDGIIIGSPVYYGTMASEIKKLFDDSVKFHGSLDGKAGAAFSSSANIAGGNETTILDILAAMLIHGMIIQGDPKGDHYGSVSISTPDERTKLNAVRQGQRIAKLVKQVVK